MRARRISEGERTQSGVDHMGLAVQPEPDEWRPNIEQEAPATDEPRTEGVHLGDNAKRFCQRCESLADNVAIMVSRANRPIQVAAEEAVVVAPTGTVHLARDKWMTLCGREYGDW